MKLFSVMFLIIFFLLSHGLGRKILYRCTFLPTKLFEHYKRNLTRNRPIYKVHPRAKTGKESRPRSCQGIRGYKNYKITAQRPRAYREISGDERVRTRKGVSRGCCPQSYTL